MAAPKYCTADQLKERLCLAVTDDPDNVLEEVVAAASRWVDRRTGRRFYTATETRYYTASPRPSSTGVLGTVHWNPERPSFGIWTAQYVEIDDFVSVTTVATDEDADGVYERTWTAGTDYWLGPRNAALEDRPYRTIHRAWPSGRYIFPNWENAVAVTGSCGAAADTPDPIRELSLMVAENFARPILPLVQAGAKSYTFGTSMTVTLDDGELPPMAQLILAEYGVPMGSVV